MARPATAKLRVKFHITATYFAEAAHIMGGLRLVGGGAGVFNTTQLASFSLPVRMSAFRLMMTREALCQQAGWSDVEVTTLTHLMNSYQPVSPFGRAMTDVDQTAFDGMLQQCCVDARQGFFNALKTWSLASSDEISHFLSLTQSLGSVQPKYCPAPSGPVATTPTTSSTDQITAKTVLDHANCTISGGGKGVLSAATISKFQAALAATMSKFHQAILRSQLCTIHGLDDAAALQLTQMVEGIHTITPTTGELAPDETTSFLYQLQTWCIPARKLFVAQLVAWPPTSSTEKQMFLDAQMKLGDSQPSACNGTTSTPPTALPPTVSRPALTFDPPGIHRSSPTSSKSQGDPTTSLIHTPPPIHRPGLNSSLVRNPPTADLILTPQVIHRPTLDSSNLQDGSLSSSGELKEQSMEKTQCQLRGGGVGHFTKKSMVALKSSLVNGKSSFSMTVRRQQLCLVLDMSDSEVKAVEDMLSATPILYVRTHALS
ncbi:hypothetical protein FRB98_004778 [Tulasnella sp. 332]|nr:hypothetical protein FRB98_004778 [Tulasnella sp. 332]